MSAITDNANKCNTQQIVTVLCFVAEMLQKQQNTFYMRWDFLNAVNIKLLACLDKYSYFSTWFIKNIDIM
jgi:hypothetical protein